MTDVQQLVRLLFSNDFINPGLDKLFLTVILTVLVCFLEAWYLSNNLISLNPVFSTVHGTAR